MLRGERLAPGLSLDDAYMKHAPEAYLDQDAAAITARMDGHNGPGGESGGSTAGAQTGMNPKRNAPILPPDLWRWRKLSGHTACVSDSPQ